jgi:uncharacterized membrane protein YdjX (TVP38/TMEM64 family)
MKRGKRIYIVVGIIILFIVLWTNLLYIYPPKTIVDNIGIENGYMVAFLVAAIGGITSFTGSSYYIIIATLSSGGLNPFYLGIVGGIGATISDIIFFSIGKKSRELISKQRKKKVDKLVKRIEDKPKWTIPLLTFFYAGLTPFPNDILTISLGITNQKFKYVIPAIMLGNIISTIIAAYIGASIIGFLFG